MTESEQVKQLVKRLDKIAKENDDNFRYYIGSEIDGFCFVAQETADNHEFVAGFGGTIAIAVRDAESNVKAALKDWGYKES